ncbi:MAG: hypothetical protein RL318_1715 [Fibrobacterota bacterium]
MAPDLGDHPVVDDPVDPTGEPQRGIEVVDMPQHLNEGFLQDVIHIASATPATPDHIPAKRSFPAAHQGGQSPIVPRRNLCDQCLIREFHDCP